MTLFGALAGRLQRRPRQAFVGTSQSRRVGRYLMPAGMVLFDEPAKPGIALHARASRDIRSHMLILQDGEAQQQCIKLVPQQGACRSLGGTALLASCCIRAIASLTAAKSATDRHR